MTSAEMEPGDPLDVTDPTIIQIMTKNQLQWGSCLDYPEIRTWLSQFETSEVEHAKKLLFHYVYYGTSAVKEMYRLLYRKVLVPALVHSLLKRGEAASVREGVDAVPKVLAQFLFVAMTPVGKSGPMALYDFMRVNGLRRKGSRKDIDRLERTGASGAKGIVFVDDFIGTGDQVVDTCWPRIKRVKGIGDPGFLCYLAPIGVLSGIGRIRRETSLYVDALQVLDSSSKVFSSESWVFEAASERSQACATASKYGSKLWPEWPLGYGDCQLLLGFHWQPPDNTLPIMWHNEKPEVWFPLFPRG